MWLIFNSECKYIYYIVITTPVVNFIRSHIFTCFLGLLTVNPKTVCIFSFFFCTSFLCTWIYLHLRGRVKELLPSSRHSSSVCLRWHLHIQIRECLLFFEAHNKIHVLVSLPHSCRTFSQVTLQQLCHHVLVTVTLITLILYILRKFQT